METDTLASMFNADLLASALRQPKYDYANPTSVRKRMSRNLRLAEAAGFWMRYHSDVEWFDRVIPTTSIRTRVYHPKIDKRGLPGIVFFHGGAFVSGDLDFEHPRCLELCRTVGAVVVSVDYRLAPEKRFPAALDDCERAVDWIMHSGSMWGIDPSQTAIVGCSAGGCLAAGVVLKRRDGNHSLPRLQALIYPVLDNRMITHSMQVYVDCPVWTSVNAARMWEHYLGPIESTTLENYAIPMRVASLRGLPATYIMVAEHDPLRDEAMAYARRLVDSGVRTELHHFPGTFHGFDTLCEAPVAKRARAELCSVLRDSLQIA